MEKFAGYGFNKSHSAAYALLSYQTAWLKAHHPAAERIGDIVAAREKHARRLVLRLTSDALANGLLAELKSLLQGSQRGRCPVVIDYQGARASAELVLPDPYRVRPSDALLERLAQCLGCDAVELDYGAS